MRFTNKTEYGLISLIHMANGGPGERITVKSLAERESYSTPYVEKIFQQLKNAGIVISHQGNQGGYTLAKGPAEITLKEIIEALEGETFDVFCEVEQPTNLICNHNEKNPCGSPLCGLKHVWRGTKDLLDRYYGSITLEHIAKTSEGSSA